MTTPKLTGKQRYHLALIWYFRVFGAVFAIGSVLIAASNFAAPRGQAIGDLREIAVIGVVFFTVGCGIYLAATRTLKWYRRQLGSGLIEVARR
jgi:hypothetical protein